MVHLEKTLILVFELPASSSDLFWNKNHGGCPKCILRVFGTFWGKYFFEKLLVFLISSDNERKHFGFCRKYFNWDFATAFHVLIGTGLGETLFVRELDFLVLPQFEGKTLGFCRNYLPRVVKAAFNLSIGTLRS